MKKTFLFSLLVLTVVSAEATPIVFSDRNLFLTLTGATAATTIPTSPITTNTGFTSGSLAFSLIPGVSNNFALQDWTTRLNGTELAVSGTESFNINITSGSVFSFGFDFVEPQFDPNINASFVDSTFEVTLLNGGVFVGSFIFSRPNDSAEFVGFATGFGEAFDRVEIREITGGAENECSASFTPGSLLSLISVELLRSSVLDSWSLAVSPRL